jgi:NAD(P)-dependent dehydrogenase (short-subunit alcohol dehydrogenase family)
VYRGESVYSVYSALLPVLEKTATSKNTDSRIVNVGSRLEKTTILPTDGDGESRKNIQDWMQHGLISYTTFQLYANSKLCMLSCSNELSRKLQATKTPVTVNTVTPGMVNTNLSRFMLMPLYLQYLSYPILYAMLRTPQKGAKTVVWAATAPELQGKTGLYFGDMKAIKGSDESLV